jgi:predicted transcriptional regulator
MLPIIYYLYNKEQNIETATNKKITKLDDATQSQILKCINTNPYITLAEIANNIGIAKPIIHGFLTIMIKRNKMSRNEKGEYHLDKNFI